MKGRLYFAILNNDQVDILISKRSSKDRYPSTGTVLEGGGLNYNDRELKSILGPVECDAKKKSERKLSDKKKRVENNIEVNLLTKTKIELLFVEYAVPGGVKPICNRVI